jgi:hypothetical protein
MMIGLSGVRAGLIRSGAIFEIDRRCQKQRRSHTLKQACYPFFNDRAASQAVRGASPRGAGPPFPGEEAQGSEEPRPHRRSGFFHPQVSRAWYRSPWPKQAPRPGRQASSRAPRRGDPTHGARKGLVRSPSPRATAWNSPEFPTGTGFHAPVKPPLVGHAGGAGSCGLARMPQAAGGSRRATRPGT